MAATTISQAVGELIKNGVVHNATAKHSATLIFLHGLGDTGHGWGYSLKEIKQPHLKVVCPTAAIMPVTINGGYRMPSWFDIYSLNDKSKQDEPGILTAAAQVQELLEYEQTSTGIPSNRIVLGGFSQGGSLAMYSALTYGKTLGGILALSSYLSLHHIIQEKMTDMNKEVPFLQCHGDSDPMVNYKWGQLSSEFIQTFNKKNYKFKTYAGLGHSSTPQEMLDVQDWLSEVLPPTGGAM